MNQLPSKDKIFVFLQVAIFTIYAFGPDILKLEINEFDKMFGLFFSIIGIIVSTVALVTLDKNLTPFPTPVKNGELITNGIFAYMRHPIYSGLILFSFAYGIYTGSILKLSASIVLAIFFDIKSRYEEGLLMEKYKNYREYMKKVQKFIPYIY